MPGPLRAFRAALVAALGATLLAPVLAAHPAQASPKPPNPSDQQISAAQANEDAAAHDVGTISARIALAQTRLDQLDSAAQLAEQKLALALQRQREANDVAARAREAVRTAQAKIDLAHRQFVEYAQQTYMDGSIGGTTGVLLTADDPSALLEQGALQQYVATHQIDAIGQLSRATVVKSNADAVARRAVEREDRAASEARAAQHDVLTVLSQAKTEKAGLDAQLVADRQQLQAAQITLTGITDQRAAYVVWKRQQIAIAKREAERMRQMRIAQQAAAAAEAERLRHERQAVASNGRHSGEQASGGSATTRPPSSAGWTAAKGQEAVNRAMRYVGWPYSWAAGDTNGPTYGVSEPGAAWNDSNIRGFDCSGLTLYAWAPYLRMDHYSATQYNQAGSYHPTTDNLMPGDLLFWNGGSGTISHEAMYIGGGDVIQAPQSGDVIKITNLFGVESGYVGATRPLT